MSATACSRPGCNKPCHIGKNMCIDCYKEHGDYTFGMDSAIKAKIAAKFDPNKAAQAQAWLEALSGTQFPGSFHESLKDGVILCRAVNAIKPGIVRKINESKMAFKQRENITFYLNACKSLGVKEHDCFVSQDLFEGDNLSSVVDQVFALGGVSRTVPGFNGPYLGVKHASENKRVFSEATLAAGRNVVPLQSQGGVKIEKNARTDHIVMNVSGAKATSGAVPLLNQGGNYVKKNPRTDHIVKNVSGAQATSTAVPLFNQGGVQVEKESRVDHIIRNVDEVQAQRGANNAAPASAGAKFCGGCGAARQGAAKFCGGCGAKF